MLPATPMPRLGLALASSLLAVSACAPRAAAPTATELLAPPPLDWRAFGREERTRGRALVRQLLAFLGRAKTVRAAARELGALARARGFTPLPETGASSLPGMRYLLPFKKKALALFLLGRRSPREGLTVHLIPVDAPRLDLKEDPAYARHGFLLLQTHLYGPLDLPHWLSTPLALHGYLVRDGGALEFAIGESPNDPVLVIPDLLLHLSRSQHRRVISPERMDAVVAWGSEPSAALRSALRARGLDPRDLQEGEWSLVPARAPRLVGVDRSLVAAYGQSFRTQAFVALESLAAAPVPERAQVLILLDRSRLGFSGNTGAFFVSYALGRLFAAFGDGDDLMARRILGRSRAFVAEPNAGQLGAGMTLNRRYDDSDPALQRAVIAAFRAHRVPFQIAEAAGGDNLARRVTRLNLTALDVSLPIAAADRPLELTSLFDLLAALRAYRALASL